MARMSRAEYAALYGPTTGDCVRLGDTGLLAEIEHDTACRGRSACMAAARRCATASA